MWMDSCAFPTARMVGLASLKSLFLDPQAEQLTITLMQAINVILWRIFEGKKFSPF